MDSSRLSSSAAQYSDDDDSFSSSVPVQVRVPRTASALAMEAAIEAERQQRAEREQAALIASSAKAAGRQQKEAPLSHPAKELARAIEEPSKAPVPPLRPTPGLASRPAHTPGVSISSTAGNEDYTPTGAGTGSGSDCRPFNNKSI